MSNECLESDEKLLIFAYLISPSKGPFIFYERGGAGGIGGGHSKKIGLKGGASRKKMKERGGGSDEKIRLKIG